MIGNSCAFCEKERLLIKVVCEMLKGNLNSSVQKQDLTQLLNIGCSTHKSHGRQAIVQGAGNESFCYHCQDTLHDVLYADGTLIFGTNGSHVEELARAVENVGLNYGLKLHWGKTQTFSMER